MFAIIEAVLALIGLGKGLPRAGGADVYLDRLEAHRIGGGAAPAWGDVEGYEYATWAETEVLWDLDDYSEPWDSVAALDAIEVAGADEVLLGWLEQAEGWGLL